MSKWTVRRIDYHSSEITVVADSQDEAKAIAVKNNVWSYPWFIEYDLDAKIIQEDEDPSVV